MVGASFPPCRGEGEERRGKLTAAVSSPSAPGPSLCPVEALGQFLQRGNAVGGRRMRGKETVAAFAGKRVDDEHMRRRGIGFRVVIARAMGTRRMGRSVTALIVAIRRCPSLGVPRVSMTMTPSGVTMKPALPFQPRLFPSTVAMLPYRK